jgi:hypothetical protein
VNFTVLLICAFAFFSIIAYGIDKRMNLWLSNFPGFVGHAGYHGLKIIIASNYSLGIKGALNRCLS